MTLLVYWLWQLHHDAEQVHHGIDAEHQDQGAQVPHAHQHADQHDHPGRAEGILVEAGGVHAQLEVADVAGVADGGQVEMGRRRDQQEDENGDAEGQLVPQLRVGLQGAGVEVLKRK